MTARIYRHSPSVTQSGPGAAKPWRLAFDPEAPRSIEPLMGWTSSGDMKQQIRLSFETREEAVAYAEREGIPYRVESRRILRRQFQAESHRPLDALTLTRSWRRAALSRPRAVFGPVAQLDRATAF